MDVRFGHSTMSFSYELGDTDSTGFGRPMAETASPAIVWAGGSEMTPR